MCACVGGEGGMCVRVWEGDVCVREGGGMCEYYDTLLISLVTTCQPLLPPSTSSLLTTYLLLPFHTSLTPSPKQNLADDNQ